VLTETELAATNELQLPLDTSEKLERDTRP